MGLEVGLLKGSQAVGERRQVCERLARGELQVVVGTHALIQEGVAFRDLRVAVVDEQHRFGVHQRDALAGQGDSGVWPHTLHMTATPIPRTLSLTLYGDLDLSVIDELPPGRTPVRSHIVFPDQRAKMWQHDQSSLDRGRQAYVVCPLIGESEALQVASAVTTYEEVSQGELAGYRVLLLHGRLPPAEKQATMAAFAAGEADVLVSTTVVEVGVDVANATVMVIESARRFGLSQLHQLRGRVGRGADESHCMLMADREDDEALDRLALFARTTDGFALAEADLRARGEGQLFGERQSGFGDLHVARLLQDQALLIGARATARALLHGRPRAEGPPPRVPGERRRKSASGAGRTGSTAHETAVRVDARMTSIRIIGGSRRGHRLRVPVAGAVRPTGDRVREAVFDVLGPIEDLTVLDLFAGSGALGFEALSRGAGTATFVESDPQVLEVLHDNARALGFTTAAEVLKSDYQDALAVFAAGGRSFDLLFVDPPYRMLSQVMGVLDPWLPGVLAADGVAVVEGPLDASLDTALDVVFERRYGSTMVTMITKGRGHR